VDNEKINNNNNLKQVNFDIACLLAGRLLSVCLLIYLGLFLCVFFVTDFSLCKSQVFKTKNGNRTTKISIENPDAANKQTISNLLLNESHSEIETQK
jgi:hypothetical protein